MMIRAVVVEDEPLSRRRLLRLLAEHPDVTVVGEAGAIAPAIALIQRMNPNLVFLDIRLEDGTGFDVLAAVHPSPAAAIVFVTAFDQFAVRAFDICALDYLLKPFDAVRLRRTLDRARARLRADPPYTTDGPPWLAADVQDVLEELRREAGRLEQAANGRAPHYLRKLAVPYRDERRMISIEEVDYFTSADNYVEVHTASCVYLVRRSLAGLAERLNPQEFVRVHRRAIVRIGAAQSLRRGQSGELAVLLHSGESIRVGRAFRPAVNQVWREP